MGRKKKEDEFYVEVVVAAKVVAVSDEEGEVVRKRGKKKGRKQVKPVAPTPSWEYLVKWHNFDDSENSWEPAGNLHACTRLLGSFWSVVGIDDDDKDYHVGEIIRPPDEWIEKEKRRFAREQEEAKRAKEGLNSKKRKRPSAKEKVTDNDDETKASSSSTKFERKKKAHVIESDSDLNSDTPLYKKRRTEESSKMHSDERSAEILAPEPSQPLQGLETIPKLPKKPKGKRSEEKEPSIVSETQSATLGRTSPNSLFSEIGSPAFKHVLTSQPLPTILNPPPLPHNAPPPPLPVRTTSAPSLPTRVKAPPNSHVKIAAMPSEAAPSSAGISTKQRLAQGALAPTLPKNMGSTGTKAKGVPLSPIRTGSTSMMTTGFRKSTQISPAYSPHEPTLASLNAPPASPPLSPSAIDMPITHSHIALDPGHSFGSEHSEPPFETQVQTQMQMQVDDFLSTIMPTQLAAPLEAPEVPVTSRPPPALPSKVPALPSRSVKVFKWEGSLLVTSTADATDTSFGIVIENESDVKLTGFSFSILLNSLSQLKVRYLYHIHDLSSIIPACKTPTQFAKVSPQSAEDKKPWVTFLRYLTKSKKVMLIPLHLDGNVVAHLLLAPSKLGLPSPIITPLNMRIAGCLVASILPWSLTPTQIAAEWRSGLDKLPDTKAKFEAALKRFDTTKDLRQQDLLKRSLKSHPTFHEAIRVLDFPPKVYAYLKQTNRPWAICPPHDSGNSKSVLEVELMRSILSRIKEEAIISHREEHANKLPIPREAHNLETAHMMFIHVGALQHLNKLTCLRDRILSPEYVRFYTFGSHPSVYSNFWGVREIYPCGGVVTFLPSSFILHPYEMMKVIKRINEHPFWTAYILPCVLGMVAQMSGMGTTSNHDSLHSYLLKAIEDGQIALIEAPPDNKYCYGEPSSDRRHRWFNDYLSGLPPSEQEALSLAHGAFNSKSANIPQAQWQKMMEQEVAEDMMRMQRQPVFMLDYRRYVVLTGTMVTRNDSLEWLLPSEFSFKDAFLQD